MEKNKNREKTEKAKEKNKNCEEKKKLSKNIFERMAGAAQTDHNEQIICENPQNGIKTSEIFLFSSVSLHTT